MSEEEALARRRFAALSLVRLGGATCLTMGLLANDGAVSASTNALRSRQTSIQQQQSRLQTRLTQIEQRLTQQYSTVKENITKINSAAGSLISTFG